MEKLKSMKDQLTSSVQAQLANIEKADYHELGAAIDMIKDIAETEYYCSVVKAMEEKEQEKEVERYYYTEHYMPIPYQRTLEDRDMDRHYGRMYYDDGAGTSSTPGHASYTDRMSGRRTYPDTRYYEMPYELPSYHDPREGRSASRRKMYMEGKEMHQPKEKQMQELESYVQDLTSDITDMIHGASPEERAMLQQKLSVLATKIGQ